MLNVRIYVFVNVCLSQLKTLSKLVRDEPIAMMAATGTQASLRPTNVTSFMASHQELVKIPYNASPNYLILNPRSYHHVFVCVVGGMINGGHELVIPRGYQHHVTNNVFLYQGCRM